MILYPNQLIIFHVEKYVSSAYLVVNEFLFKYNYDKSEIEDFQWSVPNKISDVYEPLHPITTVMSGQGIAWY